MPNLRDLNAAPTHQSINPINPHQARAAFNNLRSAGYDIESVEDLVKLRREDPFEREMLVAAEVRAYFQVAYKVSVRCDVIIQWCAQSNPLSAPHRQRPTCD